MRTVGTVAMAVLRQSCADDSETVATALPVRAVAKALRCQSSGLSSEQARRPRLRLTLS